MIPVFFISSVPQSAWATTTPDPNHPAPVLTPKNVHVNKKQPKFTPYAGVQLPAKATDHDITFSHAFPEPIVPVGGKTTAAENQALSTAIKVYLKRKDDENVSSLTGFIAQYRQSPWDASLDMNIAEIDFRTGNFSQALDAWQDAWDRTQNLTDPVGQQLGNLAVAKLAKMKARIGRTDELEALFQQIKGRHVSGVAAQLLVNARYGLWLMKNRPQEAFRCGPSALQELSLATKHKIEHSELIKNSVSTPQGIALTDVQKLAGQINMPMQMAKRSPGAPFLFPAVIHWKLGHYAALIGPQDGKYMVHDTTFGDKNQFLVSAQALEQETSGYFLVPKGPLPQGWTSVDSNEGSKVFGRGHTGLCNPWVYGPLGTHAGGDCGSAGGSVSLDPMLDLGTGTGGVPDPNLDVATSGGNSGDSGANSVDMTIPSVNAMLVSLNLVDTPVRYTPPPIGPAMHFTVQYNQREIAQPSTFTYANLGPNWTFSYLSYVTPSSGTASVYERGGGVEMYTYNAITHGYSPSQITHSVLSQVNSTTWQKVMPSGDIETFGQPDGSGNFFLTQITDSYGNSMTLSYDSNFRLVSLTDAIGQVTTITYKSDTSTTLPDFYLITKVTDPFGRYAQFDYDGSNRLQKITDIIGITSQFTYSSDNFVTSLTTPYGVTSFAYGDILTDPNLGGTRWLETTYPDGNKTRTEFRQDAPGIASTDPKGAPSGMYPGINVVNDYMGYRNTYYWNRQAMKDHPGDYTKAQITHWLHTSDINTCSGVEESLKKVNQNRIWYGYAGQPSSIQIGDTTLNLPTMKGRIMDDNTTQLFQYQYNAIGKVTQEIDPTGRETDYVYDTNQIDLLTVKQKTGSSTYDTLASYTYNSQHEILTATDASGQTTTNTYYSNGELHTTTNAKSQTTTFAYDSNGYLTSVTGPVSGSTSSFTYDSYGRVRTATDSQGYVTTTDYDAMDRPTQVTYPDSTTSQVTYSNLDVQMTHDRLGRWTRYFYNSLRQPVEVVDSQGNVTTSNWTLCAGLASIVDPAGHATLWKYDNQNRPIEKDYPDGHKIQTSYENTTSRVHTTTDPNGNVATMSYNIDNTVSQVAYSAGSGVATTPTVSYTYDSVYPRVHTMVDGVGTTTYTYNSVYTSGTAITGGGRVGSVTVPVAGTTATMAYTSYDELGRVTASSLDSVSSGVTYDTLGRVTQVTNALTPSSHFTYTYLNHTGRVASVTNPNGQSTTYTYQDSSTTAEPRLSEIKNLNASSAVISKFDYGYDAQGQITSWTQQTDSNNPQNWAMQYDNEGKLLHANVTDTTTSAIQHQYAYLYDVAGNRTSEQIDGNVTGSTYNNLNQLTGQSAGGKMVFNGTLSKPSMVTVGGNAATSGYYSTNFTGIANVTSGTNNVPIIAADVNGNVATNTYQLVIPPSSGSYTYDLNGNQTNDGTRTYTYDAKNELTKITYADTSYTTFTYNGSGARVEIQEYNSSHSLTSTKWFVGNEERDGSNITTKRYFYQGEQRIVSGTPTNYYYTFDHLGSIREVVADDGNTIDARYSYDPYGRRTKISGSLDSDLGFTGYYFHATSGLYLSATRPYNPNTGRFTQRDPSGESSGMNLYGYCAGNPVNLSDPSGLVPSVHDQERFNQFADPSKIDINSLLDGGVRAFRQGGQVGVRDYFGDKPRYVYNKNLGWIDLQHVAASEGVGIPVLGQILGLGVEVGQFLRGEESGFQKEDIAGNAIGDAYSLGDLFGTPRQPLGGQSLDEVKKLLDPPQIYKRIGGGSSESGTGSCMDDTPFDPTKPFKFDFPPLHL